MATIWTPETVFNKWKRAGIDKSCWNCIHAYWIHPRETPNPGGQPDPLPALRWTGCVEQAPASTAWGNAATSGGTTEGTISWCSRWRRYHGEIPTPPTT